MRATGGPTGTGISFRIAIAPARSRAADVCAALFAAGAGALQELDDSVVVYARDAAAATALCDAARAVDPGAQTRVDETADVDWTTAWRAAIRAHTVEYLTVTPPWLAAAFLPERRIVIEPAMAFGTGDHPTTRGVLRLMQDEIRRGDFVADLGAGSAVLAIGAAKLGAARVAAVENDPDAIGNARANVAANDVAGVVRVVEGDAAVVLPLLALESPVRVVLANIVSGVIRDLLPAIAGALAPDGAAILSGMLASERAAMRAALEAAGFAVAREIVEDGWWTCSTSPRFRTPPPSAPRTSFR